MVDKEVIRRLHEAQGWSEREIARELGFARMTVRKYLRQDASAPRYQQKTARTKPVLGPVLAQLQQWVEADQQQPRKQRRTAHQLWRQLCVEHHFAGAEATVRAVVRQLKAQLTPRRDVFIPLEFAPGERAEVDWGTAQVVLAGSEHTVHLFCARLRYSGAPFVQAFASERQEAFFAGHVQLFAYWGGVPRSLVYDNLTTAVQRILAGHGRQEQEAFVRLRLYYHYEAIFCNPAQGHEKGAVENLVGTVRRRYLAPVPTFGSLDELNTYLLACCAQEEQQTRAGQTQTVGARLGTERAVLTPLPARPFDASRQATVKVTSLAEVSFETNRYSVPVAHAHQWLELKAEVATVRLFAGAQLVAEHVRCYARHQRVSDWRHYLPLLARKPGAVPYAAALKGAVKNGELAPIYETFRLGLCARSTAGNRDFVRVLELCAQLGVRVVTPAVEHAVASGAYHVDVVRQLVEQARTPRVVHPPLDLGQVARDPAYGGLAALAAVCPAPVSTLAYNQLLSQPPPLPPLATPSTGAPVTPTAAPAPSELNGDVP